MVEVDISYIGGARGDGADIVTPAMLRDLEMQYRIETRLKEADNTRKDQEIEIDRRLGR